MAGSSRGARVVSSGNKSSRVISPEANEMPFDLQRLPNVPGLMPDVYEGLSISDQMRMHEHAAVLDANRQKHDELEYRLRQRPAGEQLDSDVTPEQTIAEVDTAMQLMRGQEAFQTLQNQADAQNHYNSLIAGHPVAEGVAVPYAGPVHVQDALAAENLARSQGRPYSPPDQIYNDPPQFAYIQPPREQQDSVPYLEIKPSTSDLRVAKASIKGTMRDLEGNMFLCSTVTGVDIVAGQGSRNIDSCKRVVCHTTASDRTVAFSTNADDLAEWYLEQVTLYTSGLIDALPAMEVKP